MCLAIGVFAQGESRAVERKVSASLSHYIMAVMYDDLGEVDKAIQEYKRAAKNDYENTVIHLNLAVSYLKKNRIDKAVEELNTSVRLDPEAVEPHAVLAFLYSLQNMRGEANREYETALKNASKLNPQNIEIYRNLGLLYLRQKKLDAAERMYRLILEVSYSDPEAHFYLANIYEQRGDKQGVEEELKKSLESKPNYAEALNYLGYFYVEENKNLDAAETMIKKALESEPYNGAYIDSLGWLYYKTNKLGEAITALSRAAVLLDDPVIFEHLGDAYFANGNMEDAEAYWQKSLKLNPVQDKIKRKIEELNVRRNSN